MKADMVVYKGKINAERTGVMPMRGQGLAHTRSIKLKGGRQFLEKHGLKTGAPVEFMFPKTKEKSTQYNYMGELIFR